MPSKEINKTIAQGKKAEDQLDKERKEEGDRTKRGWRAERGEHIHPGNTIQDKMHK